MKLGKKLMVVAMAVVTFGLVGCNMNEDEYHIIDFDAPGERAEINYTNNGIEDKTTKDKKGKENISGFIRGWATFNTNHRTANCLISFTDTAANTDAGNLGYVWNMRQDSNDKTYSFYVITFRSTSAGKLEYYLSYYNKVGADYLSSGFQNFCDKDGVMLASIDGKKLSKAGEVCIVKGEGTNAWKTVDSDNFKNENNKLSIMVKLEFVKDEGYKVSIGKDKDDVTEISSKLTYGLTGEELKVDKAPNEDLGCYAMVKPGKNLVGTWTFSDVVGNPIVIDEIKY